MMSEKVKLTQEQAEAIESVKNNDEEKKNSFLEYHLEFKHTYQDDFKVLNKLTIDEIARAIHDDYEVEPEFKVGDWVAYNYRGLVSKVVCTSGGISLDNRRNSKLNPNDFKHATPEEIEKEKQRRWWKKHGRDVWELKNKDTLINVQNRKDLFVISRVGKGTIIGYSFITEEYEHLSISDIKTNFEVFCFSEDRKDV